MINFFLAISTKSKNQTDVSISDTVTINGINNSLDNTPILDEWWNQQVVYNPNNGHTYISVIKDQNVNGNPIILDYYNGSIVASTELSKTVQNDYHDQCQLAIDSSGYIWVFLEQHGNNTPFIWRSNGTNNISSFTEKTTGILTYSDYPHWYLQSNGNFAQINRTSASYYQERQIASSVGESWSRQRMTENPQSDPSGSTNLRHYSLQPANCTVGVWHHIQILKRVYIAPYVFTPYRWWLKTQDFNTFFNYEETWSKNITSAAITESELNTNALFYSDPDHTYYMQAPLPCAVTPEGYASAYVKQEYGNEYFYINTGSGWIEKQVNFIGTAFSIVPFGGGKFDVFTSESGFDGVGSDTYVRHYRTFNNFDNVVDNGIIYTNVNNIFRGHAVSNKTSSPYVVAVCTDKEGDNNVVSGTANNDLIIFKVNN